jgi:hypothetical protein
LSGLKLKHQISIYFDDEVISLLDLGVQRPREAMTFGAPETEALHEGYAQKGFGFLSLALDGSIVPLGSTATNETTGVFKTLWGRWKPPDATGSKPVDQEAKQHQTN